MCCLKIDSFAIILPFALKVRVMPRLEDEALISVRLFTMEHYISEPIPELDVTFSPSRSYAVRKVPVLRIFGPTPAGQKCCLHLHGVFPYVLVPVPPNADDGFASRLASSLDRAINITMAQSESRTQHVYKIDEVSGVPFYGYHPKCHSFFKIYMYNPLMVARASDMLLNGVVMDMKLQPHESHVPYTLQFMMDHEVQGMNLVRLTTAKFRRKSVVEEEPHGPVADTGASSGESRQTPRDWIQSVKSSPASSRRFNLDKAPPELFLDSERHPPISTSELELDAVAADIVAPKSGGATGREAEMGPGMRAIWTDERERRSALGIAEALTPPSSPPRPESSKSVTDSETFWTEKFKEKLEKLKNRPEKLEASASRSSDPDATCNLNPGGSQSQKSRVYPVETPEGIVLKKALAVEAHVPSLASSSSRGEKRKQSIEEKDEEEAGRIVVVSTDDTIVDEDLLHQSQVKSDNHGADLDDDDLELIELFAALGEEGASKPRAERSSRRSSQLDEEDERETQEMNQIIQWESDDLTTPAVPEASEGDQSTDVDDAENDEELWNEDDESFWNNLDVDKYLYGVSKP